MTDIKIRLFDLIETLTEQQQIYIFELITHLFKKP